MHTDAEKWIKKLELTKHPEGGYFREVYRSQGNLELNHGIRNISTAIYYLLTGDDFSAFHKIKSDELWHFYQGNTCLTIYMISPEGELRIEKLGTHIENQENLMLTIPANYWFAVETESKENSFVLAGCTVSPGFDFQDFEMGQKEQLIQLFPQHTTIINRLSLI